MNYIKLLKTLKEKFNVEIVLTDESKKLICSVYSIAYSRGLKQGRKEK